MDDHNGYAVFFFPQALEALGDAIKPYLGEGAAGAHVVCRGIDTGGSLIKMTLDAQTTTGEAVELELMVPGSMVRMIVSTRSEEAFGFGPRVAVPVAVPATGAGKAAVVMPDAEATTLASSGTENAENVEEVKDGPKTPSK